MTKNLRLYKLPQLEIDLSTSGEEVKVASAPKIREAFIKRTHNDVGFYDWPTSVPQNLIDDIQSTVADLRKRYDRALLIGIGGSHLGAAAVLSVLRESKDEKQFPFLWLNNIDVPAIERAQEFIAAGKCATIVISKSGETLETLSAFLHLSGSVDPKGIVCITDAAKGELRRLADSQKWKSFPVPGNIGGRFSVLSAVGLLPIALGGISIHALLQGARSMKEALEACAPEADPALIFAAQLHGLEQKGFVTQYLMPYCSSWSLISDWYVQLFGESLGKGRHGPTPATALGTRDQHSLLQLFKEGPLNKVVGFLDVTDQKTVALKAAAFSSPPFDYLEGRAVSQLNALASRATQHSLFRSEVPTYRLTVKGQTPESVAGLLFFFEVACAYAGEIYQVNAYDQPGVEEAKKLLKLALESET